MMDRYLIEYLLTDAGASIIGDAVMDVDDTGVVWVGPADLAPSTTAAVTRLTGLVTPGLINAHCHTPMLLLRGAGEGLPTDRWLAEVIWPREGRLSGADVAAGMRLGAAEMLRNGITSTVEMYFFGDEMANAARQVGLRTLITPPLIEDAALSGFGPVDEQLAAIVELARRHDGDDMVEIGIGPHAAYSLSRSTLDKVAEIATRTGLLVHIHVAEQAHEGDAITDRTGLSVPAYLDEIGLLGPRTLAAHCVWVSEADIELLAQREVAVAHCPVSNGRHASGIAPVTAMRAAGISVAIGTDGPASHDRIDLFEDLRTAIRLARIRDLDAAALPVREALAMATCGAAIGRDELGRLQPGSPADFIRIDIDIAEFEPLVSADELAERMVWVTHPELIRDVWVAGCQRVADREVVGLDMDAARAEVRTRARALAAS
jgi:5-methylthioadenosine/S-adenosylhomocysteine deaminase